MNIVIEGARVHNLKDVDVEIPRDKLVVVTGVSGSGKSSLAFDTVYAEGQRHYMQSLSTYARQLLHPLARADVESIRGLSPAIAVPQRRFRENPRSTVGTLTEIHDRLRLLFTHAGRPHCLACGRAITVHSVQQMVDDVLQLPAGTRIQVLAPLPCGDPREFRRRREEAVRAGFVRMKVDGRLLELDHPADVRPVERADLVVDRLAVREQAAKRLADSIEVALEHGNDTVRIDAHEAPDMESRGYTRRSACLDCGAPFPEATPQLFSFNSPHGACPGCKGLGVRVRKGAGGGDSAEPPCPRCGGARLRSESLHVKVRGMDIAQLSALPVSDLLGFIEEVELDRGEVRVVGNVLREVRERIDALRKLELGYLALDRSSDSLSGGECQRLRLAAHVGARLSGVIYVLDEPTVGLHPRDTARLMDILRELRDAGNTVLVVEHDRDVILAADYVIDMGPGAGAAGGEVLASGTVEQVRRSRASRTGPYLARTAAPAPRPPRTPDGVVSLRNARRHNLKDIHVDFPVGLLTCVTGVSGSGKSTLVVDTLYRAARLRRGRDASPEAAGLHRFDRVLYVDQDSIGRSRHSTPATYAGLFDPLRSLFARLPEARTRGYAPGRFSYNAPGGRCEACLGAGTVEAAMQFLPDVSVTCDACAGRRYNRETLEVLYKGASIADVLDLTVAEALDLLGNVPRVRQRLESLWQVGLGYLRLGQPANTLSGGEAQRVKLARELGKKSGGKALYLFDEPTTGLHFEEVGKLMEILDRLVEAGHTVVAIEHHPDFLMRADHIVDLGPEGGDDGGYLVAAGAPEEVMGVSGSATGRYLKAYAGSPRPDPSDPPRSRGQRRGASPEPARKRAT